MANQIAMFAETIAAMKKAVKRKAYDSDSDSSVDGLTNRGNKLRKKARFMHEGQLAAPNGPLAYKRTIEHAGYRREVISTNVPLIDEDGYEVDSDDDDERAHNAAVAAAELDPYSDIRLENLLVPLTAASDLPDHPTLSKPFTSRTLTDLCRHADLMVQKEKATLWKVKHLLTRLSGDSTWMPCSTVEVQDDFKYFIDERFLQVKINSVESKQATNGNLSAISAGQLGGASPGQVNPSDMVLGAVQKLLQNSNNGPEGASAADATTPTGDTMMGNHEVKAPSPRNGLEQDQTEGLNGTVPMDLDTTNKLGNNEAPDSGTPRSDVGESDGGQTGTDDQDGLKVPHRMRTRAQAQAASDNTTATSHTRSASPEVDEMYVDPYFLAPRSSFADRNVGLPQHEAEETRRLLQLYIQKQEEVCRGAQKVYEGLMKADQRRKLVLKWCKAEAHIGVNRDMSDGEDWYDKEEWNLDEDLKKGQDEEEEDAATTAKKTRTRRQ